jgi:hypothetical protein
LSMAPVSACRPAVLGSGPATVPTSAGATDGFAVSASVHPTYHQRDRNNNKNQIKTRDLKGLHAWGMEGDPDLGSLRGLRRRNIVTRPRTRPRVLRGRRCRRCRHIGFSISGGRRVAGLARRLCGRFRTGGFRGGGFRDGGERAGVRLRRVSQGQAGSGACATSVRAVRRVSRRRRACGRSVAAGFAGAGRAVAGGIG